MTINMATEPKSDQMNYDDFIGGVTKTITITDIKSSGNSNDQPISIHYEGDNGKPYKPCKSMRRVMVHGWGDDGLKYIGKSLILFGDPDVKWAGKNVGGIRISHLSHIEHEINVSLTSSKGQRKLFQVKPLKVDMGNIDEEVENVSAEDIYKEALFHAEKGIGEYQKHFTSLNKNNKKRLNDSGDHEKLKAIAKSHDEIPVDPTSQDQEAGNVESEEASPLVDAGSTTAEPFELIRDDDKKLSCNDLIAVIEISPTVESVDDLVHLHSNFIEKMNKHERQAILGATNSRKGGLRDA